MSPQIGVTRYATLGGMYAPAVFVDESKARSYPLAPSRPLQIPPISPGCASTSRRFAIPGSVALHFTGESKQHRKAILRGFAVTRVSAIMYDASAYCNEKAARSAAMSRMVDDSVRIGATLLVVERDDSTLAADRKGHLGGS